MEKNTKRYTERWDKRTVIENDECKLCWDFEYHLLKTTTARQPDVTIDYKNKNKIFLIDIACQAKTMWMQSMQRSYKNTNNSHSRSEKDDQGTINGNPNSYWLLRWRHETSDKPDLTTDITLEKNKSDIKRNGGGSTI